MSMKNKSAENLRRLSSVAVGALLILALLAAVIPAFAAPVQGDGYWQDTFSDSTGINASASTNISVSGGDVNLALQSVPRVAFSDSFEETSINASKWTNSGWTSVTDQHYDGSRSARAQAGTWLGTDTHSLTSTNINLADATSAYLDFWYRRSLPNSGTCILSYYNGTSWNTIMTITGTNNNWVHFNQSIPLPDYQKNNFQIRFFASLTQDFLGRQDTIWIDALSVSKTVSGYCPSGSLTSINISPSNLQSWSVFTASDDNPWPYKKPVTIINTGTALTDYQTGITVSYVSGEMNSDFSDLRFKDGSGNTLSYWIESYTASSTAKVWVKVPSIAAGGTTTLYMYYGNTQASSASNGPNTFIFFDDFSGDLSKWTKEKDGANISIVSGYLECGGGTTSAPYGHTVLGSIASYSSFTSGIIEGKVYLSTDGIAEIGYRGNYAANTGYKSRMDNRAGQGIGNLIWPYVVGNWTFISTGGGPSGTAIPSATWYNFSIAVNGSSLSISGAGQTLAGTNTTYAGPGEISLQNHYGAYSRFDDIRVRKYAATVPTTTLGGEETVSIAYQILRASDNAVLCTITAAQAAAGFDISSCAGTTSAIKLRANMISTNLSLTPVLHDWQVTYLPNYNLTLGAGSGGNVTAPGMGTYTYARGTVVDIVATPDSCHTFASWSGDTGTIANPSSASTTITMNSNCSIQANFNIITYTLSVSGNNSGGSPYFDGTSPFNCGATATIHANTSSCAVFAGWTPAAGIANASAANTTVSMTQNRILTANYIIKTYNLSYSAGANGALNGTTFQTVNCGTSGSAVTAVPNACYHFVNWSDASTANPRIDTNVHANIAVTANFAINISTLSLTANNSGGSPRFNGTSPFNCGVNVNIYANTSSCYTFAGWTPTAGIANPSAENTTVLMDVSRSLTANYIIKTFNLSVSGNNSGGSPYFDGASPFNCGVNASIHANISPCYTFAGWTPTAGVANASAQNTTVLITADTNLTAKYVLKTYTLSVSANNSGGTPTINGTSPFACGANVSIYSGTKSDYMFAGWTPTAGIADPSAENTTVLMTQNRGLTASYIPIPHTIDITAPSNISTWALNIGSNTNSGSLAINVTPNSASWSATAKDNNSTTSGYMTGWNGTAYNPLIKLINAMHVQGPDAEVTLPNAASTAIAHGTGDYPGITITFKQEVTWSDDPGTYQIVVTFIGTIY